MSEFYDRMLRGGWTLPRHLTLVVAAGGAVGRYLLQLAACVGFEDQVMLASDPLQALEAADAAMAHNPAVLADVRAAGSGIGFGSRDDRVLLIDVDDPVCEGVPMARNVVGFSRQSGQIELGLEVRRVAPGSGVEPSLEQRPLQFPEWENGAGAEAPGGRAEDLILIGDLLSSACGFARTFSIPGLEMGLAGPPRRAAIPVSCPPDKAARCPIRLYVAGIGGALSHMFFLAASMDESLQRIFSHPDSLIVGCDPQVVEESNRSRQVGYRRSGGLKCMETAQWIEEIIPGARVAAIPEQVSSAHFETFGSFDAVLSSLDSWDARSTLARLSAENDAGVMISSGSDFVTASTRMIGASFGACPWEHGREMLNHRDDRRRSCADGPAASNVLPQAVLGGLMAASLRDHLLGREVDPRGFDVHLLRRSEDGLLYSPGPSVNAACPCPGLGGGNAA